MSSFKIVWSNHAKTSLKDIFNYYKEKSPQGARNVRNDLLNAPKKIHYANQYQYDDVNPRYRRIVVRNFKVLYREEHGTIKVIDIISTSASTEFLESINF